VFKTEIPTPQPATSGRQIVAVAIDVEDPLLLEQGAGLVGSRRGRPVEWFWPDLAVRGMM
jgi:hypothetical protein